MTSNIIKFIFNNKIREIHNPNPNETILNYIRLNLKKTGTKEGCAEGGCGACTVVIGELEKNKIVYKAINSCIAFTTNFFIDDCIPRLLEKVVDVNSDSFSSFNTLFTNVKYVVAMSPFIYYTLNPCFVKIFYEFDRI